MYLQQFIAAGPARLVTVCVFMILRDEQIANGHIQLPKNQNAAVLLIIVQFESQLYEIVLQFSEAGLCVEMSIYECYGSSRHVDILQTCRRPRC